MFRKLKNVSILIMQMTIIQYDNCQKTNLNFQLTDLQHRVY